MMNFETFLLLLMIVSVLTGLVTEGIKKLLDEAKKPYRSNLLAGVVAVILSIAVDLTETLMNEKMAVILIALVLLSWLCAMVGYDKVIQAISQFKVHTSE